MHQSDRHRGPGLQRYARQQKEWIKRRAVGRGHGSMAERAKVTEILSDLLISIRIGHQGIGASRSAPPRTTTAATMTPTQKGWRLRCEVAPHRGMPFSLPAEPSQRKRRESTKDTEFTKGRGTSTAFHRS